MSAYFCALNNAIIFIFLIISSFIFASSQNLPEFKEEEIDFSMEKDNFPPAKKNQNLDNNDKIEHYKISELTSSEFAKIYWNPKYLKIDASQSKFHIGSPDGIQIYFEILKEDIILKSILLDENKSDKFILGLKNHLREFLYDNSYAQYLTNTFLRLILLIQASLSKKDFENMHISFQKNPQETEIIGLRFQADAKVLREFILKKDSSFFEKSLKFDKLQKPNRLIFHLNFSELRESWDPSLFDKHFSILIKYIFYRAIPDHSYLLIAKDPILKENFFQAIQAFFLFDSAMYKKFFQSETPILSQLYEDFNWKKNWLNLRTFLQESKVSKKLNYYYDLKFYELQKNDIPQTKELLAPMIPIDGNPILDPKDHPINEEENLDILIEENLDNDSNLPENTPSNFRRNISLKEIKDSLKKVTDNIHEDNLKSFSAQDTQRNKTHNLSICRLNNFKALKDVFLSDKIIQADANNPSSEDKQVIDYLNRHVTSILANSKKKWSSYTLRSDFREAHLRIQNLESFIKYCIDQSMYSLAQSLSKNDPIKKLDLIAEFKASKDCPIILFKDKHLQESDLSFIESKNPSYNAFILCK